MLTSWQNPMTTPPFAPPQPGAAQAQSNAPWLDRLATGLLGTPAGDMTPEQQKAARQQGLLALGAQLMAGSGPSATPVSFGQALGPALMAGQQAQRQYGQDMLAQMLLRTKLQKASQPTGATPASVAEYEYAKANGFQGSFEDWKRVSAAQQQTPSAIRAYEYWKSLPTEQERNDYLTVQRNMQPYQLGEMGGGKVVFNRATGQYEQATSAAQEAAGAGQIAAGTAGGKVAGETTATAQFNLPQTLDSGNEALRLVDELRNHPGRKMATGGSRMLGWQMVPATDAYDFDVRRKQIAGQQFMQAYETLKGGGQITEVEGQQAKEAIARMDAAQSEGAFTSALDDYQRIIKKGMERARLKAQGNPGASKPASGASDPLGIR